MVNDDRMFLIPGGVCRECEHTPLYAKVTSDGRIRWICPECGQSDFMRNAPSDIERSRDPLHAKWSAAVRARDNNACVICGSVTDIDAHHLIPYSEAPKLRYLVGNGITLCRKCHKAVHNTTKRWPDKYE